MKASKMIERHQLPCGPMAVSIDGVCRRRLRDHFDQLLDRLAEETHPEGRDPEDEDIDQIELVEETQEPEESDDEKKERLIKEGKMKAEVKHEVEKYKNKLMGNSKMLQDRTGKIKKR